MTAGESGTARTTEESGTGDAKTGGVGATNIEETVLSSYFFPTCL